jgi:hypothetical protein
MRAMHGMHRYFIQNSFVSMFVSLISLDPRNIGVDDLIDIHLTVPDRPLSLSALLREGSPHHPPRSFFD